MAWQRQGLQIRYLWPDPWAKMMVNYGYKLGSYLEHHLGRSHPGHALRVRISRRCRGHWERTPLVVQPRRLEPAQKFEKLWRGGGWNLFDVLGSNNFGLFLWRLLPNFSSVFCRRWRRRCRTCRCCRRRRRRHCRRLYVVCPRLFDRWAWRPIWHLAL